MSGEEEGVKAWIKVESDGRKFIAQGFGKNPDEAIEAALEELREIMKEEVVA